MGRGGGWIEAHSGALATLGEAVRSGVLGADLRFLALRSARGFTGLGVVEELAEDSVGLLSQVFGRFDRIVGAHDGQGGPEAEAKVELGNDAARGTLLLSRLRTFSDRLEIAGTAGRVVLDRRTGSLTAEPAALLADLPARARSGSHIVGSVGSHVWGDHSGDFSRLRHPWEVEDGRAFATLSGKRVLVTGATGFIGARVVERLAENGVQVTAVLRDTAKAARLARLGVELAVMGGRDLAELVRGHDAVVNLAHDFHAAAQRNEGVSLAIADACEAAGVPLLVQASSIAVYDGWPGAVFDENAPSDGAGHSYKQLKRAIERDLEARQAAGRLRSVILQPTVVYGAFSKLWTDRFAESFAIGDIEVPDAGLCEGVHVDDVADSILAAIARPEAEGRFIVSGPAPFAWREMLAVYPEVCRDWGTLRIVEAPVGLPEAAPSGRPGALAALKARAIGMAAGFARRQLGEERLAQIRAAVLKTAARGARPLFRPAAENPRLFANRAAVSTARMRAGLVEPSIGIDQGGALVHAYLAWRYCPFEDWPGR